MAYLYRLAFLLCVLCFSQLARADFPATLATPPGSCTQAPCYVYGSTTQNAKPTVAAYCAWFHAEVVPSYTFVGIDEDQHWCKFSGGYNATYYWFSVPPAVPTYSCPANAGLISQSTCRCQSGLSELNGQCMAPNVADCAKAEGEDTWGTPGANNGTVPVGSSTCMSNGCTGTVRGGVVGYKDGKKTVMGLDVVFDGLSCQPEPASAPVPSTCKGSVGKVNGIDVCVPFDPNKNTTVTGSTTKNSGTPAADGKPAVPGTTTTSQTSCIGSKCTTSTTTTTGGSGPNGTGEGSTTKTETTEQPKDDFCKSNPRASVCVQSKYGAGDCKAPPACEGDAIQCGIAALQLKTACALSPDDGGKAQGDFDLAKAVLPGDVVKGLPGNATLSIGPGSFDQTELLSGSCIADRTVTILSKPFVVPFSGVCPHLELLGQALVSIALLAAAFIVFRG